MGAAIRDSGLEIGDIDAVYASANGTIRADRLEARAIHRAFGSAVPAVVALKAYCGEYAAGSGFPLAGALLALRDQVLHPSCGFEGADPELRVEPVRARRAANVRNVLVNSLSAGGGIVCAVVSREDA